MIIGGYAELAFIISIVGLYYFAQASLAKQSNSLTYCLPLKAVNRHQ